MSDTRAPATLSASDAPAPAPAPSGTGPAGAAPAVTGPAVEAVTELAVPSGAAATHAAPTRVALARTRTGQRAIVAALVAFAALFGIVRANRTAGIDEAISRGIQRHGARVAPILRLASWPGFPPQSRLIPPAIVASLWAVGLRLEAVFQLGAWSTALLSSGLKALARRPRPAQTDAIEVVAAPLRGSSFPSGHVLTYVGVYGFLAHLVGAHVREPRARRIGVAALAGLVGLVGPSRIHQGHHWPSDVLGSYLVGLPLLALFVEAYRGAKARLLRVRAERLRRESREAWADARELVRLLAPRRPG